MSYIVIRMEKDVVRVDKFANEATLATFMTSIGITEFKTFDKHTPPESGIWVTRWPGIQCMVIKGEVIEPKRRSEWDFGEAPKGGWSYSDNPYAHGLTAQAAARVQEALQTERHWLMTGCKCGGKCQKCAT